MADFLSVIENIGGGGGGSDKVNGAKDNRTMSNGDHNSTDDSEEEIDEKELEEQVSDLGKNAILYIKHRNDNFYIILSLLNKEIQILENC